MRIAVKIRFALPALLIACMFALPTPAAANEQTLAVCANPSGGQSEWDLSAFDPLDTRFAWRFTTQCPYGATLSSTVPTGIYWTQSWSTPTSEDRDRATFTKASFDLSGSDGSDGGAGNRIQGVKICAQLDTCTPLISPSGPNVWQPEHHELSVADGGMPEGTNEFRVVGACKFAALPPTPDSCTPGRPLEIGNLRLTFEDDVPPTIEPSTGGDLNRLPLLNIGGWNSGAPHDLPVEAADALAGVRRFNYEINANNGQSGASYLDPTGCGDIYDDGPLTAFCPTDVINDHVIAGNTANVKQGANKIDVTAIDGAGNVSQPLTVAYKLDSFRPAVTALKATTTVLNNWQPNGTVNLVWNDGADKTETATHSAITSATAWAYTPSGGALASSKVASGSGVEALNGLNLPGPGLWRVRFAATDAAGNQSDVQEVQVGVDSTVPQPPVIDVPAQVGGARLGDGVTARWSAPPSVPAGICGYAMSVDQVAEGDPGGTMQLPASATATSLPRSLPDGANYVHLKAFSCSGVPGVIATGRIDVDASAPEINVTDPPASGWYDSAHPLTASIGGEPGARLSAAADGAADAWSDSDHMNVALIDGEHVVTIKAVDAAGNESVRVVSARYDDTGPTGAFAPVNAADPTRVNVAATDPNSGVAAVQLQYRAIWESEWHGFGAPAFAAGQAPRSTTVMETFPDQGLADGRYALRAVMFDAAGHRSISETRADGTPAVLNLPLRRSANITFGFATTVASMRCVGAAGDRVCKIVRTMSTRSSELVPFGATASMNGTLRDASGDPIGGAALTVYESVLGGPPRLVGDLTTAVDGGFSFTPRPGTSRRVSVRYGGSAVDAPATADAKLLTRGKVLFVGVPRRARGGSRITLAGHIVTPGVTIPPGLNVQIQYRDGDSWRMFPAVAPVSDSGDFSVTIRFPLTDRAVVYRLRARVPSPQAGWPYEEGVSAPRRLVVR